jgi:hypothetical protein
VLRALRELLIPVEGFLRSVLFLTELMIKSYTSDGNFIMSKKNLENLKKRVGSLVFKICGSYEKLATLFSRQGGTTIGQAEHIFPATLRACTDLLSRRPSLLTLKNGTCAPRL